MNSRNTRSVFFITLLFAWLPLVGHAEEKREKPPNIVFIICDDLNDALEGWGPPPVSPTPHIDRLQDMGVSFSRAYANNPLCGPSRASLLSGLYLHTSGLYEFTPWNRSDVLETSMEMLDYFKRNGYAVLGTGKLHTYPEDYVHAWPNYEEDDASFGFKTDFGPWPWDGADPRGQSIHPEMRWILEGAEGLRSESRLTDRSVHFKSFGGLGNVPVYEAEPDHGLPGHAGWRLYGKPFRYEGPNDRDRMPDELSAAYAAEVLARDHDQPFILGVGFVRPHEPLYVPDEYLERFPLDELELPRVLANDHVDISEVSEVLDPYAVDQFTMLYRAGGVDLWKRWVQAYLASISFVDDQVGVILDALENSPYADNTIVVFTSDHGFHMGEKGVLYKKTLWEKSLHVPLIIAAPGVAKPGSACGQPVSLIDLYPTLLDLAGLPGDPNRHGNKVPLDGYSLRPLLENPESGSWEGPEYALSSLQGEKMESDLWHDHSHTLRGERWSYTLYYNSAEELYDHANDPHEWFNLADHPKHAEQKAELKKWLIDQVVQSAP